MTRKNKVQIPTQAGLLKNTILLENKLGVGTSIHQTEKTLTKQIPLLPLKHYILKTLVQNISAIILETTELVFYHTVL